MRAPDIKSVVVAAFIGAAFLWILQPPGLTDSQRAGYGAAVGAAVQFGVRILGVS
jgi:hypothetical protein